LGEGGGSGRLGALIIADLPAFTVDRVTVLCIVAVTVLADGRAAVGPRTSRRSRHVAYAVNCDLPPNTLHSDTLLACIAVLFMTCAKR